MVDPSPGSRSETGAGDGLSGLVVVFGEPVAEHGGEPVGLLDVGEVPAVGEHRQPPVGQQVHRGLGLVGGQDVVAAAPDDQGRGGQGGEAVEQDLTLPAGAEQGAGHRGGGLELAGATAEGVVFGEELGGCAPGLGEQHRRGHAGAAQVATGHPADHDGELADDRQGVQGQQGVDLPAEAGAVDQGQRSDALWVGHGQAQRDRSACGVPDHVERRLDVEGVEERGHERGQVAAGGVPVGQRGGVAVTGQAQGEYPVGAGEGGDDPSPAGGALLVPVQQQQRRTGSGLQVLGVVPFTVTRRSWTMSSPWSRTVRAERMTLAT